MKPQLLNLFDDKPSFNNFMTIGNSHVVEVLQQNTYQFINLDGGRSSGKSHLLQAWTKCHNLTSSIYLNANDKIRKSVIKNLAVNYNHIAIDNIDYLSDIQQIELFDLFNTIKQNTHNNYKQYLLTSADIGFEHNLNIRDDLKTRILSGLNLILKLPDDEEIIATLHLYANKEGITIHEAELQYMLTHYTRNIGTLVNTINIIVKVALLEKRNITIPLIKQVIQSHQLCYDRV